jgi:putative ABC transport system permease protein
MVRVTLLIESGLIATEGVLIGAGLALATSYQLATNSDAFGGIQVAYVVPWLQLVLLLTAVLVASLLTTLPSMVRASAMVPVVALQMPEETPVW